MKCPLCGEIMNYVDLTPDHLYICKKCGAMRSMAYMNGYRDGYERGKNEKSDSMASGKSRDENKSG